MASEPPTAGRDDPVSRAVAAVADCWGHAASIAQDTLCGCYGANDTFGHLAECWARAVELGVAALSCSVGMHPSPKPQPPATRAHARATVPSPAVGSLTLHAGGFRAIGFDSLYWIHPPDVTIAPAVLKPGDPNTCTVTLSFDHVSNAERASTIIYEGDITDATGKVLCTVRIPKPAV